MSKVRPAPSASARNPLRSKKVVGGLNASGSALAAGYLFLSAYPEANPWQLLAAMLVGSLGGLFQCWREAKLDELSLRLLLERGKDAAREERSDP